MSKTICQHASGGCDYPAGECAGTCAKTGGPAFGQVVELRCVRVDMTGSTEWEPEAMVNGGLTVRDYFAAKALVGLLGEGFVALSVRTTAADKGLDADEMVAHMAYRVADAMIAARGAQS